MTSAPASGARVARPLAPRLSPLALALVVTVTLEQLVTVMPRYQSNLEVLIARAADIGGIEHPTWDDIVEATLGKMNLQAILLRMLGGLTSLGLTLFLVVIYAAFLMGVHQWLIGVSPR